MPEPVQSCRNSYARTRTPITGFNASNADGSGLSPVPQGPTPPVAHATQITISFAYNG